MGALVNTSMVDAIASSVMYEGYMLYPYRASALKNRQRFNFGVVWPHDDCQSGEAWFLHTECLLRAADRSMVTARVRFLQLYERAGDRPPVPDSLDTGWQDATEREVVVRADLDVLCSGRVRQRATHGVAAEATLGAERMDGTLCRVAVHVSNLTPVATDARADRHSRLLAALVSTHVILHVENGEFLSMFDPPADARAAVRDCRNTGLWPVLVGEEQDRDAMLAAPIILYDHPRIAPESAGDFFDGTEIDEMLALRVLTLTDDERRELREGDDRARRILERTESLTDDHLRKLHGVLRRRRRPGDEVSN